MDPKSDEGIFLGYSTNSRAYIVFNSRTKTIMESINVVVDDVHNQADVTEDVGTFWDITTEGSTREDDCSPTITESETEPPNKSPSIRVQKNHPKNVKQAEDGIRDYRVTGVQTCALPI